MFGYFGETELFLNIEPLCGFSCLRLTDLAPVISTSCCNISVISIYGCRLEYWLSGRGTLPGPVTTESWPNDQHIPRGSDSLHAAAFNCITMHLGTMFI